MNTLEAFNWLVEKEGRKVNMIVDYYGSRCTEPRNYTYKEFIDDKFILFRIFNKENKREFEPVLEFMVHISIRFQY